MYKKTLFVLVGVLCLFAFTGCGSNSGSLSCEKVTTDEDGYKVTDTINVTYKNNKVTNVENINLTEMDPSTVDMTISFANLFTSALNEVSGMNVQYSKENDTTVKYIMTVDYNELDIDALKETFGDDFDEESFYSSKNITIDEFKEKNLTDYTCQ